MIVDGRGQGWRQPAPFGGRVLEVFVLPGGVTFGIPEADWPRVGPLLDRVLDAMPD